MWSNLRTLSCNLLRCPEWTTESKRSAYVFERIRNKRLNKLGAVYPKKQKKMAYYYKVVENTDYKRKPLLDLILTTDVPGVGMRGERIQEHCYYAYRDLLLPKLAVYADSEEAQVILSKAEKVQYSSKFSKIVENYLAAQAIPIILSYDIEWTLQPWHVKVALRKSGILANEDCITLPEKTISGPGVEVENKDFIVKLTMNKSETFPVRCRIYQWSASDLTKNQKKIDMNSESEPLFPEDKEAVDALIKIQRDIRNREKTGIKT